MSSHANPPKDPYFHFQFFKVWRTTGTGCWAAGRRLHRVNCKERECGQWKGECYTNRLMTLTFDLSILLIDSSRCIVDFMKLSLAPISGFNPRECSSKVFIVEKSKASSFFFICFKTNKTGIFLRVLFCFFLEVKKPKKYS